MRDSFRNIVFLLCLLFLPIALVADETLNNDAILKLVKAGLSEDVIVTMVRQQPGKYSTSVDEILALKKAGASDKVIGAMISAQSGIPAAAAITGPSALPAGMPSETGVYYKKGDNWVEIFPEVINWRTGGVLKSVATVGIVKGDMNGRIAGSSSHTTLKTPVEVLVYTPDGVAITEFQLIKLRPQKEGREFRTVTGGVFHVSSGATRDVIPFDGKRVGPRAFVVDLNSIGPGEYGFLPPLSDHTSKALSSLGKMYTFRIFE